MNERSEASRAEQANKRVVRVKKKTDERVAQCSGFLVDLAHCGTMTVSTTSLEAA